MVQTRAQSGRTRALLSGDRPPHFMRAGPSGLKPQSSRVRRVRKRKKEEPALWPLEELVAKRSKSSAAVKIATTVACEAEETPTSGPEKPTANVNTRILETIVVQQTPFSGQTTPTSAVESDTMATSTGQESTTTALGLPKEHIEQHILSIMPRHGAGLDEVEATIRSIESPCGNVVWSSSKAIKVRGGNGAATLEIAVIYNDCSRHRNMPHACRMMHNIAKRGHPPSHDPLRMEDVVGRVRGLTELVAACGVVARRSWAVNAISHGGSPRAS